MKPSKARGMVAIQDFFVILSMVLKAPGSIPHLRVIRAEHSSLAGCGHDLVLAEGKSGGMTHRSDLASFVSCALRLCALFDHAQTVFGSKIKYVVHLAWPSSEVHRDDCFGSRVNGFANGIRGNVLAVAIHVHANGASSSHRSTTRRSDKSPRRRDYFIAVPDAERS